jgi:hypothetical protein
VSGGLEARGWRLKEGLEVLGRWTGTGKRVWWWGLEAGRGSVMQRVGYGWEEGVVVVVVMVMVMGGLQVGLAILFW